MLDHSHVVFGCFGFFGQPNFGDELLCRAVVQLLHRHFPGSEVQVFTNSARVSEKYSRVTAFFVEGAYPWPEFYVNLLKQARAIRHADLLVVGGGGLINDYYSWSAVPRFLLPACAAILFGRPYVFVGLGIVGVRRWWLRRLTKFALQNAVCSYCRDEGSIQRARILADSSISTVLAPDLALALELAHNPVTSVPSTPYVLLNFRRDPEISSALLMAILKLCLSRAPRIVLLATEASDVYFYDGFVQGLETDERARTMVVFPETLDAVIALIGNAKCVVAERLHVTVVAVMAGRPLLCIEYEDKVSAFLNQLDAGVRRTDISNLSIAHIQAFLDDRHEAPRAATAEAKTAVESTFHDVICRGLNRGLVRSRTFIQLEALIHLIWLGVIGVGWASAVLIKRAIFGRSRPVPR